MKLLLLLLLPVSVVCQDSSLVKWNARKKGKSPADISLVITADIKKGFFIHPCEDCSFNDWQDEKADSRTDIDITADSNWTVKQVFSKNKYKQKTDFEKDRDESRKRVIKGTDTTYETYSVNNYRVDCRVYNKMKLFRGLELVPSDSAVARYIASLPEKDDPSDKDNKKREKLIKDASKTLATTLTPPDDLLLTIRYEILDQKQITVLTVPNTYKTRKVWGWKKTPRRILNKEEEYPAKTEDK
jgi:hypothetical protein